MWNFTPYEGHARPTRNAVAGPVVTERAEGRCEGSPTTPALCGGVRARADGRRAQGRSVWHAAYPMLLKRPRSYHRAIGLPRC
jgi:hypothetical protein